MRYGNVKVQGGPVGNGVTVTDVETGEPIKGIEAVDIEVRAREPIRVNLTVAFAEMNLMGKPSFRMADPRTGSMRKIAKVVFADGQVFEPETE